MDKTIMEKLNSIVSKDITAITEADKAFLRARRSYLTGDQLNKFSFIFGGNEPDSDEFYGPSVVERKQKIQNEALDEASYKELQVIAKKFGIKKTVGLSREKLIEAIKGTDWM